MPQKRAGDSLSHIFRIDNQAADLNLRFFIVNVDGDDAGDGVPPGTAGKGAEKTLAALLCRENARGAFPGVRDCNAD